MSWKFSCHSSSSSASSSCTFYKGGRLLLSSITIITIVLLVLSPSPSSLFSFYVNANDSVAFASPSSSVSQSETTTVPVPPPPQTISSQSSQSPQSQEKVGPSADNFDLSDGYIIEPFLSNLSMPTSIAVDSANGTLYVAESIKEYNNNSSIMLSTSSSPDSFLSQQAQIRIVKDAISGNNNVIANQTRDSSSGGVINIDNNTTFINNALNWPVIDMEVDDGSGLLYAFHDHTTISRINTTSGEREDILTTEEEPDAGSDKYDQEQQQQDPLSLLVSSSSQIALSGKEDYLDGHSADDEQGVGNHNSYNSTMLYIPCMNGDVDNDYGTYCILGLPIDRSGNNAIVDNISSINSSSFILENMTSRPVGIAILNSSSHVAAAASSSSIISEQQGPYTLIGSQTPNSFGNNNDSELLIITSQPTRNTIFNNSNNYSADALSSLSTIYHAKVFGSIPYQSSNSNNLQDTTNNNNDYSDSNNNHQQQPALLPSIDTLVDYPDGQLGQVAVVFVRPVSASPISTNETTERNQALSTDDDIVSSSSSPSFGLNETTAFMVDFGNSSASAASATPPLPRIMMLDVQSGSITQFLTLKHPDPNFTPIDIAFDSNNSALYVLSSGNNNQEEDTNNTTNNTNNNLQNTGGSRNNNNNNSSGVIWKISYQGEEGELTSSSDSNGTDNDNSTSDSTTPPPPPPPSSSNDTDSSGNTSNSNSSDDSDGLDESSSSSSYDEEEDDTDDDDSIYTDDDDSIDTDNSNNSSNEDTDNNSGSSSSPPPSDSPPPSTPQPVNDAPIAEDDAATTDQDTPVVIDVLANDMDTDDDNPLTIDSVDEESIQGGNVRIISSSSGGSNDDSGGNDNNNGGSNTNEKIEYTPAEGFFGNDEFTYTIIDRNGATDSSRVTVTVNEVILSPHPIIYWLENDGGITQDLLEKAAEGHDNYNNNNDVDEWSFNLGNFRVPVEFDVSDSENDTKGILEGGEGNNNNDDDNTNAYDQLAAQLLTSKLNIENGVSTCESIETTIEYADTVLRNALYNGPGSTENPISESRDYAFELIEILDRYNNEGCV